MSCLIKGATSLEQIDTRGRRTHPAACSVFLLLGATLLPRGATGSGLRGPARALYASDATGFARFGKLPSLIPAGISLHPQPRLPIAGLAAAPAPRPPLSAPSSLP